MMTHEMRKAVEEAEQALRAADNVANDIAKVLHGRLRKVSTWHLKKLKAELKNYNMHTGRWKD
jgi:hypothetical protein